MNGANAKSDKKCRISPTQKEMLEHFDWLHKADMCSEPTCSKCQAIHSLILALGKWQKMIEKLTDWRQRGYGTYGWWQKILHFLEEIRDFGDGK
jgi:hypothetical protein